MLYIRPVPLLLAIVGAACNLIATAAIFVMPMYQGVSLNVTSSGERTEEHTRKTLLEMQSLEPITIFFFSAILVLSLAAAFLAVRAMPAKYGRSAERPNNRRNGIAITTAGALLLFGSFISGFSVGAYYFPGALLVFLAGILLT